MLSRAENVGITHDSSRPREQLLAFWETTKPASCRGWGKSTRLGYGHAIIMGAKLAAPELKDAVGIIESGAPFPLETVAEEGYDFSRYPAAAQIDIEAGERP